MKEIKICDIECYHNYFCVGIKDYNTKEKWFWEISEERNDIDEIYNFFINYEGFLVTVNGIHYDNVVVKKLLKNYSFLKNLQYITICSELKEISDDIIVKDDYEAIKEYKWFKTKWVDVDLFCYWSKMLRISKQMSLKSLAVQLNYPVIQELPFSPDIYLKKEDLQKLRDYNQIHDLGITELLFEKMKPDFDLRAYILEEYKLPCWSMDAPKIASEYLLEYYCSNTWNKQGQYWEYKKNIRDSKYHPSSWTIGDYLPQVNFKTQFFQEIYQNVKSATNDNQYAASPVFKQKSGENVKLSISSGGIHTINNNQVYKETNDSYIIDADIQGLYPTLFRHYRFIRKELDIILNKYVQMIDDRTDAKRKGEKKKDTFLKLCNNAFSGLVDSTTSWLYSPEHILALRVFGQLIQLRFIEDLNNVGITTIFSNTDGTLVKCPKHLFDKYHQIAQKISEEFKVTWEFCKVKSISFVNTNTYISIIEQEYMLDEKLNKINVKDKEKIKRKGFCFKYDDEIPLGDSVDEQIIAKSLSAYFINNIQPKEFISNPHKYNLHIYDYCKSNKIKKSYLVIHNGQKQQQLNRYYFSKTSPYLYKQKQGGKLEHVNVGEGVELFNTYVEKEWKDYKINYNYYIKKTEKIIDALNNNNQLSLF